MTKSTPPSDWIAYAVVLGTVAAMLLGKFLMFKTDKDEKIVSNDDPIEEDNKPDDKS